MGIIAAIVIGFVVGLLARAIMPGDDKAGIIITTLLGIGGSLLGKYIGQGLGMYHDDEPAGFFMSLLGAILILIIYRLLIKSREGTR